jgi:murein DD-endopeptidase MepM/ murein hydrolase activator NlpD
MGLQSGHSRGALGPALSLCVLAACAHYDAPPRLTTHGVPASVKPPTDEAVAVPLDASTEIVEAPMPLAVIQDPVPSGPRSPPLRDHRLHSPMPGGYVGGWYGDTGLDIAGNHLPVYAIAAGTLDYAERGHTLWMTPPDTPLSVRLALDEPLPFKAHHVTHVYYTHMSRLEFEQVEGSQVRRHVEAGELIGVSGIGNHVAHLHLGLLLDGLVEQDSWEGILREDDIRKLFGGYRNGELLPKEAKSP